MQSRAIDISINLLRIFTSNTKQTISNSVCIYTAKKYRPSLGLLLGLLLGRLLGLGRGLGLGLGRGLGLGLGLGLGDDVDDSRDENGEDNGGDYDVNDGGLLFVFEIRIDGGTYVVVRKGEWRPLCGEVGGDLRLYLGVASDDGSDVFEFEVGGRGCFVVFADGVQRALVVCDESVVLLFGRNCAERP